MHSCPPLPPDRDPTLQWCYISCLCGYTLPGEWDLVQGMSSRKDNNSVTFFFFLNQLPIVFGKQN